MIFKLDKHNHNLINLPKNYLKDIQWKEKDLQELLYQNMEKILQDEELLVIMQSRRWQEEPDLMAIDANGDLYIFELKAWESEEQNLLQVLRYGQIYGQYSYEALNELYMTFSPQAKNLLQAVNNKFGKSLTEELINQNQHFVVITNGLDFKTRSAILYWRERKIDVRSWIYRIYQIDDKNNLIEFNTFRIKEDPFEDLEGGSYILNTNYGNNPKLHEDMLKNGKAAAYFDPWKRNIEKLNKNDRIFLYQSGKGIVAIGLASGELQKSAYLGNPKYKNEEYSMKLNKFRVLKEPLPAAEIKQLTEINYRFMQTMFMIDKESSDKLWAYIENNLNLKGC